MNVNIILLKFLLHGNIAYFSAADGLRNNEANTIEVRVARLPLQAIKEVSCKIKKQCVVTINESYLPNLLKLTSIKVVHIIEIRLQFDSEVNQSKN